MPTELTEAATATILEALRAGKHRSTACGLAGITTQQFDAWLQRGATDAAGVYQRFALDVEQAELDASLTMLERIQQRAAAGHPGPKAWLRRNRAEVEELERRVEAMKERRAT
jgi:hypothetical protein